eukprot:PhM_4_TR3053/c0_g1_i1/m.97758
MWKIARTQSSSVERSHVSPARPLDTAAVTSAGVLNGTAWTYSTDHIITTWHVDTPANASKFEAPKDGACLGLVAGHFLFAVRQSHSTDLHIIDKGGEVVFRTSLLQDGDKITSSSTSENSLLIGTAMGAVYLVKLASAVDHDIVVIKEPSAPAPSQGTPMKLIGMLWKSNTATTIPVKSVAQLGTSLIGCLTENGEVTFYRFDPRSESYVTEYTALLDDALTIAIGRFGNQPKECVHALCDSGDADDASLVIVSINAGEIVGEVLIEEDSLSRSEARRYCSLVMMDDLAHVFTSAHHIIREGDVDVKNANSEDVALPTKVLVAGGGDLARCIWYYSPVEGVVLTRARKSSRLRGLSDALTVNTALPTALSDESRAAFAQQFQGVRFDALDEHVVQVSRNIVSDLRVHHGNWNRADLSAEDAQLVSHVATQLKRRQVLWEEFFVFLREAGTWQSISPNTRAIILHHYEVLCVLQNLRTAQNDISAAADSQDVHHKFTFLVSSVAECLLGQGVTGGQYASHSEVFYSSERSLSLMLLNLSQASRSAQGVPLHELISTATLAAVLVQTLAETLLEVRHRMTTVLDDTSALWTTQEAGFLFPLRDLLQVLSDAICRIEEIDDGSASSWGEGITAATHASKDFLFKALSVGCELMLSQVDMSNPMVEHNLSGALVQLFMRHPIVETPVGYPNGPIEVRFANNFRLTWLSKFQSLCRTFSAFTALTTLIASEPITAPEDVIRKSRQRLGEAVEALPNFATYLVHAWQVDRSYELIQLPSELEEPARSILKTEMDRHLPPHLRWLVAAEDDDMEQATDALVAMAHENVPIAECTAQLSLAKMTARLSGMTAPPPAVATSLVMARTQRKFLPSQPELLSPEPLVHALCERVDASVAGNSNYENYVAAATVAEFISDLERRSVLLQKVVMCAVDGDASREVFRVLGRSSNATEVEKKRVLEGSIVHRCCGVSPTIREWCASGGGVPPELAGTRKDSLLLIGALQQSFGGG